MAELGSIPKLVAMLTLSQMHMLKFGFVFCGFVLNAENRYVICIVRNVACNNDENRVLVAKAGGIKGFGKSFNVFFF
jgi:hypothetical protein